MKQISIQKQSGAVLIVALVILVIMSVVGISSRVSSTLQQKMTTAYQQRNLAGYAAESALKKAEAWMTENVTSTNYLSNFASNAAATNGLYSNYTLAGEISTAQPAESSLLDITDAALWTSNNSVAVTTYDTDVASQPRYIIEYIGRDKGTANKVIIDYNDPNSSASTDPHVFQISAIGWSRDLAIYQVLQSTYRTGSGSGNFIY